MAAAESFNNGTYLAVFPNTAISCFPGSRPRSGSCRPARRRRSSSARLLAPDVPAERRGADLAATREVVEQDLRMCERLQGTYDAGLSADGVLSTEHESGVAHVHQLLLGALAGPG